jgi:hypothetical protein
MDRPLTEWQTSELLVAQRLAGRTGNLERVAELQQELNRRRAADQRAERDRRNGGR